MKKITITLFTLLAITAGCKKQNVSKGTPRCVKDKIEAFDSSGGPYISIGANMIDITSH